jgi:hypothetical protein
VPQNPPAPEFEEPLEELYGVEFTPPDSGPGNDCNYPQGLVLEQHFETLDETLAFCQYMTATNGWPDVVPGFDIVIVRWSVSKKVLYGTLPKSPRSKSGPIRCGDWPVSIKVPYERPPNATEDL